MKKLLLPILCCSLLFACQSGVNDALIQSGVSIGVSTGLTAIHDANTRTVVANLLNGYAPGLRTITSNPTPEQLAALIQQYTPQEIQAQYAQAIAFATPLIVNAVSTAIAAYGHDNATVVQIVNDVAVGLETGSTCCITKK